MSHTPTTAERELDLGVSQVKLSEGQNKVAVVTGASSGIGKATAVALSAAGWKVVLSGRREEELKKTADMCRWENLVVPGDVSKEDDVKTLFKQAVDTFGRLDLLFNNAGINGTFAPIDELTLENFQAVINTNVIGAFLCAREAFGVFRKQGNGGRIINNGSLSAHVPRPYSTAYTVSKHAIAGLSKTLSLDGRPLNITCTQLDIGNASTSMTAGKTSKAPQADGTLKEEPTFDAAHVAETVVHIASMPVGVTMLEVNIMAAGVPYVGRGMIAENIEAALAYARSLDKETYTKLSLTLFVVMPIVATVLNIVKQLLPQDPNAPPMVWHWFPVIGSTIEYGINPLAFLQRCREKYGDVFTFVLAGRKVTAALGSKGNDFVLGGRTSYVSAEEVYTNLTTPVFGKGVVYDCPNSMLMEQKRFVKFGLTTENFRRYTSIISSEVDNMLSTHADFAGYQAKTAEWKTFPTFKTMSEMIIYTATATLQGEEIRKAVDGSFADLYHDLDGGFKPINLLLPGLPLPMNIKRDQAQKKMSDFYVNIIESRRQKGNAGDLDMLGALMEDCKYKNGRTLSDREIAHIMIALLMAGQHTSSATSSWMLLHLAARRDIWQQLYDEQVKYFAQPDGTLRDIEYEDLRELPILDSVIRETLRVHPPIHTILRYVKADLPVPASLCVSPLRPKDTSRSYVVPKGTLVLSSPAIAQMDPRVWKDAAEWEPSRWADEAGVARDALRHYEDKEGEMVDYGFGKVSKGTDSPYQPFGAGRHRCIGEQFAYVQLGTIISIMVRRLEIKIDAVPAHNYRTMIVVPETPDDITYRRRA
ncbi:cytochrome P450 [Clavulina sp. PMI_390]|nr:cytochrome P450 [Clavulina sp. PMI_390]